MMRATRLSACAGKEKEKATSAQRAESVAVPRHRFVPEDLEDAAYENRPLPIGYGQTISQPYIVALMTDLLAVEEGDAVFELGTEFWMPIVWSRGLARL